MTVGRKWLGSAVLLAAIAVAIWFPQKNAKGVAKSDAVPPVHSRAAPLDFEQTQTLANSNARQRILSDWSGLLKWLRSVPPPSADEIRARLLATRLAWTAMDPLVRAETIRQLLDSGDDAATGLSFQVGLQGLLAGWPTLRVFLLDVLATSDPEMAATTANALLDKTTSPDEFATGLRSLIRPGLGRAKDSELLSRFAQMLGHSEWQSSGGFAEALDLARLVGSPDAARHLATWNGSPALKSMALDEFASQHPAAMIEILGSEPLVNGKTLASLMARADPVDPEQLAAVDAYLRNPDRSAEEAAVFIKSFPLRSATTGHRLYGRTPAPYGFEQIKAGDRAASEQVAAWVADPALEKYRPDLLTLQQRLSKWIEQAK